MKIQSKDKTTAVRRAERKIANHNSKRHKILEVAGRLFSNKGYANSSIDGIAAQLGVGKPYIYYYFNDKLAIFETLCLESSNYTSEALLSVRELDISAAEKLQKGLHELVMRYLQTFAGGSMWYKEPGILSGTVKEKIQENALKLHADLTYILDEGLNNGEFEFKDTKLTALLIGGSIGFMYNWYQDNGKMSKLQLATLMVHELSKIVMPISNQST